MNDAINKLRDAALKAAENWAGAEHENARNVARGGPGCEKKCLKAEADLIMAIDALAKAKR